MRGHIIRLALLVFGLTLLIWGGWQLYARRSATHQRPAPISPATVTETTDAPAESPVKGDEYRLPADEPRRIIMPSINTEGFIQKVGADKSNNIAAPNNINLAGWYTGSPKPGQPGVSIIDGHVQGRYAKGIFKDLGKLKAGDVLTVAYGDDSQRRFAVVSTDTVPKDKAGSEQYVQLPAVDSQLTLITCAGSYDKQSQTYSQRTIVRAKLIPG